MDQKEKKWQKRRKESEAWTHTSDTTHKRSRHGKSAFLFLYPLVNDRRDELVAFRSADIFIVDMYIKSINLNKTYIYTNALLATSSQVFTVQGVRMHRQ